MLNEICSHQRRGLITTLIIIHKKGYYYSSYRIIYIYKKNFKKIDYLCTSIISLDLNIFVK